MAIPGASQAEGFRHRWLDGPARILCPRRGAHGALVVAPSGGPPAPMTDPEPVFVEDEAVWLRGPDGSATRLTPPGESFFDPQLSPDGRLLAVVGLGSGLHLVDVDSGLALAHAPGGTHPAWTPDGAWLLFERVQDNGHALTAGDVWALAADDGDQVLLTDGAGIARQPATSPDGTRLAYLRDGAVWVADLLEGVSP
jgi:Tol biopolymer transport system component